MRQKSRRKEVVRHRLTPGIDIKTKEYNPYHVIEACRQIVAWLRVTSAAPGVAIRCT